MSCDDFTDKDVFHSRGTAIRQSHLIGHFRRIENFTEKRCAFNESIQLEFSGFHVFSTVTEKLPICLHCLRDLGSKTILYLL